MPILQKYSWQSIPFLRLLIPFSAGLILANQIQIPVFYLQRIAIGLLILMLCFYILPTRQKISCHTVVGLLLQLFLFVLGVLILQHQDLRNRKDWIGYHYRNQDSIIAVIQEPLVPTTKSWKAIASIVSVKHGGVWMVAKSNLLIYIRNKRLAAKLETGDSILLQEPMQKISNDFNKGTFDFARYCSFQQIYFQIQVPNQTSIKYKKAKHSLSYYLYQSRNWVLQILKKAIPNKKEHTVAEALLIGYKQDLDRSLLQSYSNTGVVHIIAISGLHLAMIYGLLIQLLQPLGKHKWQNHIRTIIVLSILWGFSFITGGAAAILRSAVGFSFLLISKGLGYKNETLNTLLASAFFLLCYNPYLLWDIGFQLSYTAVLGIVLLSNSIKAWFTFRNKILVMIWEINSITIAAQIFTLPIVLYQFHQFPNLFLFTNFLVVPLSGLILYAELLILLVSPIPFLLKWVGRLTGFLIEQMNDIIERTNRIPFVLTRNISINLWEALLLYLFICSIVFWLIQKNSKGFLVALSVLLVMVIIRSAAIYKI